MRKSITIPGRARGPKVKGIIHYVNGKDKSEGWHDGIRKKCLECNPPEWSMLTTEQLEQIIDKYT